MVAVTVVIVVQVLRAAFPQFDHLADTAGTGVTAAVLTAVCLVGFLAPLVRSVAGARGLVGFGVGGLLVVRLAFQALPGQVWLALVGVGLAMMAVTALYEAARGLSGTGFAVAVTAGLTVDTTLRLAFVTWGPVSRSGMWAWVVCLVVLALGGYALVRQLAAGLHDAPAIGWRDALGAAGLGLFLAVQVLVLASPAFVASSGWMSLPAAGAVVLVGEAVALAFLASGLAVQAVPGGVCVFGGTLLGVGLGAVTGTYGLTGNLVVVVIVAGQVLAAWLFAVACRVPLRRGGYGAASDTGGRAWRIDLGAALGGLSAVAVLLLYQLHYTDPLPFANRVLPGLAGFALGLLAAVTAARGGPLPVRSTVRAVGAGGLAVVLLVVPLVLAVTAPAKSRAATLSGTFRFVTYNVHQAVDASGELDPEGIARAIEAEHADVVALQEVGRGWPTSGTGDLGQWLARRLGMRLVWGPAADNQFGNAVLTRLPLRASGHGRLPIGAGPQVRGYVWARLDVGGGRTADVWSVHLQYGGDLRKTRLSQIGKLLRVWSGAPHTVIAGDMNASAGAPELSRLVRGTGLRRARGADAPTTTDGEHIDWIFGTDDLGFGDVSVGTSRASDHFPVAATVRVIG